MHSTAIRRWGRRIKGLGALLALFAATLPGLTGADDRRPTLTLEALRAQYGDAGGRLVTVGGVEIYYRDEGSGPAILLVHGSVSNLRTFDGVAAQLRQHYRVIRYDVPGQGLSGPVSDEAAQRERPTRIAEGLLDHLGVGSVTAVGVSSGATLCMYLAAERPDLVNRLVLSNMPADPVDSSHLKQPEAFIEAQRQAKETGFASPSFWDQFLSYFAGDPARISPAVRAQYYDFNRRVPEKNALSLVAKVADRAQAVAAMGRVSAPTLLLWGGRDPLLPPAAAAVLASYLTQAQLSTVVLPDVGHFPPLEVPDRFAAVVATYIESVTPDPAPVAPAGAEPVVPLNTVAP